MYYFKMFTLWGDILILYGPRGLQELKFLQRDNGYENVSILTMGRIERIWPEFSHALEHYFKGKRGVDFNQFSIDLKEYPPFTARVLDYIRRIPYGRVCSYSHVAQAMGCQQGSRAVGRALSRNQLPVIIPCHRVVSLDGGLGGYSGGLVKKVGLLYLEGVKFNELGRIDDEVFISR
ncbi:methylated-DNA--[protein]-cysteine S-methyltransferase [Candidatus Contubernalis alkaliaceticus]|uniref:methylated-DNA--[protein]-cysteine S-methyltransferase n=1 Tax=Candidatus Contubernalis alkaliaceticus TaxID=338645 RepID=UPI001F4C44AB|nr:MGMT family protein [Candidatus Contubernalis alkalaceticus]UNC92898.1 MGMT family protein [Candidatus Contubernalis alkalaceticus]